MGKADEPSPDRCLLYNRASVGLFGGVLTQHRIHPVLNDSVLSFARGGVSAMKKIRLRIKRDPHDATHFNGIYQLVGSIGHNSPACNHPFVGHTVSRVGGIFIPQLHNKNF